MPEEITSPPAPPQETEEEAREETEGEKSPYTLRFEPGSEFDETTLFLKGRVRGTLWISEAVPVVMRSLTGREVDAINEAVKIKEGMSVHQFNTEVTYWNLTYALESISGKRPPEAVEERLEWLKDLAAPILSRLQVAYLEFSDHVADLFKGKEGGALAKKS